MLAIVLLAISIYFISAFIYYIRRIKEMSICEQICFMENNNQNKDEYYNLENQMGLKTNQMNNILMSKGISPVVYSNINQEVKTRNKLDYLHNQETTKLIDELNQHLGYTHNRATHKNIMKIQLDLLMERNPNLRNKLNEEEHKEELRLNNNSIHQKTISAKSINSNKSHIIPMTMTSHIHVNNNHMNISDHKVIKSEEGGKNTNRSRKDSNSGTNISVKNSPSYGAFINPPIPSMNSPNISVTPSSYKKDEIKQKYVPKIDELDFVHSIDEISPLNGKKKRVRNNQYSIQANSIVQQHLATISKNNSSNNIIILQNDRDSEIIVNQVSNIIKQPLTASNTMVNLNTSNIKETNNNNVNNNININDPVSAMNINKNKKFIKIKTQESLDMMNSVEGEFKTLTYDNLVVDGNLEKNKSDDILVLKDNIDTMSPIIEARHLDNLTTLSANGFLDSNFFDYKTLKGKLSPSKFRMKHSNSINSISAKNDRNKSAMPQPIVRREKKMKTNFQSADKLKRILLNPSRLVKNHSVEHHKLKNENNTNSNSSNINTLDQDEIDSKKVVSPNTRQFQSQSISPVYRRGHEKDKRVQEVYNNIKNYTITNLVINTDFSKHNLIIPYNENMRVC